MVDQIVSRLKEGSSWAAIAAALGIFGIQFTPEVADPVVQVGTGLAILAAIFLRDRGA